LSDSEESESDSSQRESEQSSQSSEEIDSSQEEMEQINPWDRIYDLVDEYEQNGDSSEVAHVKADNALLPVYRKEGSEKCSWNTSRECIAVKKDSTFQVVMQTQKHLKDTCH